MTNFKKINVGKLVKQRVSDSGIEMSRICNFFKCSESEVKKMYQSKSLDSELLLKWSKLLEYDFFRIYSQHLILYAPPSKSGIISKDSLVKSNIPAFRKNIYTVELIEFILSKLEKNENTTKQIMEEYQIPKTTLYKWLNKYKKQ